MCVYLLMVKRGQERPIQWYAICLYFLKFYIHVFSVCLTCLLLLQSGPSISSTVNWGVNYRALNDLFQISQNRKSSIAYEVGVQMVEIYNEQVRDLLSNESCQKRYPLSL